MMSIIKWCLVVALLAPAVSAQAAKKNKNMGRASVEELSVVKENKRLEVSFYLNLDEVKPQTYKAMRFTPVLTNGDNVYAFEPILVGGRRQMILAERHGDDSRLINRRKQNEPLFCQMSTDFRPWMEGAQLSLAQDLCGCGGDVRSQEQTPLRELMFDIPVYEVKPLMAFVKPRAEAVKQRAESGSAYLDFPVNETVINPSYRRNSEELAKIIATIDKVKNDTNTRITYIRIHGYASPEGSFANNRRLAQGRAEALENYVAQLYGFPEDIFTVESTPEDWAGLRRYVESSEMPRRAELLRIIDKDEEEDRKNWLLQQVDGRKSYEFLLREVYPTLRHSDYTVEYVVRPFSVEEGKRLLKTNPRLLSLNEMFLIAQTYEPGSEEFSEVFDIAVRLFPDDATANLNAANIALTERDYTAAANYLKRSGDTPEAVHARGVLALLTGDYDAAESLLRRAHEQGVAQAAANLEQLHAKRENVRLIEENM